MEIDNQVPKSINFFLSRGRCCRKAWPFVEIAWNFFLNKGSSFFTAARLTNKKGYITLTTGGGVLRDGWGGRNIRDFRRLLVGNQSDHRLWPEAQRQRRHRGIRHSNHRSSCPQRYQVTEYSPLPGMDKPREKKMKKKCRLKRTKISFWFWKRWNRRKLELEFAKNLTNLLRLSKEHSGRRISTANLLIKAACFCKKCNKYFQHKRGWSKLVSTRRSTVLSLPLQ